MFETNYPQSFRDALKFTLAWEGDYVNDPTDRGQETRYGISKKSYPHLDIRGLTIEAAGELYYIDYWKKCQCNALYWPVSLVVFDTAVNAGPGRAARILQEELGVAVDGKIGPKTLASCNACNPQALANALLWRRLQHLARFTKANPAQLKFLTGWVNRLADLSRLINQTDTATA